MAPRLLAVRSLMSLARASAFVACLLAGLALFSCGFQIAVPGSNFPDSGVACSLDAGVGSGTLSGLGNATVGAAYETLNEEVQLDSGVSLDGWLIVGLYPQPITCDERNDAGANPLLLLALLDPAQDFGPGTYASGGGADGGRSMIALLTSSVVADGGFAALASSGQVQVTSLPACSLSGSLDLTFSFPDGGTAATVTGTIDAVYCP